MIIKSVTIEFKVNGEKFTKTKEFFMHSDLKKEIKKMCKDYEIYDSKCTYQILDVAEKVI